MKACRLILVLLCQLSSLAWAITDGSFEGPIPSSGAPQFVVSKDPWVKQALEKGIVSRGRRVLVDDPRLLQSKKDLCVEAEFHGYLTDRPNRAIVIINKIPYETDVIHIALDRRSYADKFTSLNGANEEFYIICAVFPTGVVILKDKRSPVFIKTDSLAITTSDELNGFRVGDIVKRTYGLNVILGVAIGFNKFTNEVAVFTQTRDIFRRKRFQVIFYNLDFDGVSIDKTCSEILRASETAGPTKQGVYDDHEV